MSKSLRKGKKHHGGVGHTNLSYSDEYCPHCDNHFILEAQTPRPALNVEGEDVRIDSRMIKDERTREEKLRTIFDVREAAEKLG